MWPTKSKNGYHFHRNNLIQDHLELGADVHDVEQMVEDHLKTLIVQNFDAKKADSIFTEEGGVRCLAL